MERSVKMKTEHCLGVRAGYLLSQAAKQFALSGFKQLGCQGYDLELSNDQPELMGEKDKYYVTGCTCGPKGA